MFEVSVRTGVQDRKKKESDSRTHSIRWTRSQKGGYFTPIVKDGMSEHYLTDHITDLVSFVNHLPSILEIKHRAPQIQKNSISSSTFCHPYLSEVSMDHPFTYKKIDVLHIHDYCSRHTTLRTLKTLEESSIHTVCPWTTPTTLRSGQPTRVWVTVVSD